MTIWNAPGKDAYDPHVHTTACRCGLPEPTTPLPPDHGWSRDCPRCKTPLFKKHYYDEWRCGCGWRGK